MMAPAWGADVVSSNIVGYNKMTLPAGLSIAGEGFTAIGGDEVSIQSIVAENGIDVWGGDSIRIWNGTKYTNYYYFGVDADEGSEGLSDGTSGWGDLNGDPVDGTIPAETGFWVQLQNPATITASGEVGTNNCVTVNAGLSLICNPQPCDIDIQDIVPKSGIDVWGGDSIRIWNGTKYTNYYYFGVDADEGSEGLSDGTSGWGDLNGDPVTVTIPLGQGFWINTQGPATITFDNGL